MPNSRIEVEDQHEVLQAVGDAGTDERVQGGMTTSSERPVHTDGR